MTRRLRFLVDNLEPTLSEEDTKRLRKNFNEDVISRAVLEAHTPHIVLIRVLN